IPNTEVKPSSADGSWGQRPCKSRSLLGNLIHQGVATRLIPFFFLFCEFDLRTAREAQYSLSRAVLLFCMAVFLAPAVATLPFLMVKFQKRKQR
ncbi:hypothetical protein N231_06115, partial [Geobacillus stearothermophilus ATCC 12980]